MGEKRKKAYDAYNNSEKGRAVRKRWATSNPKKVWANNAVAAARKRAEKAGVPFELSVSSVHSITPDFCPVFGTEFKFSGNLVSLPTSATLDRMDPSKGYVLGNVVVISLRANQIKNAYSADEVGCVAQWMRSMGL